MSDATAKLKALLPAALRGRLRRLLGRGVFVGDYQAWADAQRDSAGYDDPLILEKTVAAARAVRDGHAAWERDTVTFSAPAANEPLLSALREAAAAEGGRLHVLDFGGSLGSTWWQHREWLHDLASVRWSIVEQPQLVAIGQREFTSGPLRFYPTLEACCAEQPPDVILLSSVLPYLEDPHGLMRTIRAFPFRHLIIDRTGFTCHGRDRLTVQRVPPTIYPASYPCWFFDRARLLGPFQPAWKIVREWKTSDHADIDVEYRGVYLQQT